MEAWLRRRVGPEVKRVPASLLTELRAEGVRALDACLLRFHDSAGACRGGLLLEPDRCLHSEVASSVGQESYHSHLALVEAELLGLTEIYERKERRLRAEFDAERAALRADLAARDQRRPLAPVAPPEATPPPPRKPPPPPEDTAHLVPY